MSGVVLPSPPLPFPSRAIAPASAPVRLTPEWLTLSASPDAVCLTVHGAEHAVEIWLLAAQALSLAEDLLERAEDAST